MKKTMNPTMNISFRTLPLMAVATLLWTGCAEAEAPAEASATPAAAKSVQVGVMPLTPQPFTHRFSVQGNVETDRNALLTSEFGGRIEDVYVREGAQVAAGDPLVKVDTDVIERSMAELETQLELAEVVFERQQRLWDQEIGSEIEYLQAKTQLESLQRSMETLTEQKDMAVMRAPFPGVVDRCLAKTGEFAAPGAPLVRIVNLSDMKVRAMVSDHYAGQINKGMPAKVIESGVDTIETPLAAWANSLTRRTARWKSPCRSRRARRFCPTCSPACGLKTSTSTAPLCFRAPSFSRTSTAMISSL